MLTRLAFTLLLTSATAPARADAPEPPLALAPVVVRTAPEAGADDVDPATTELRVTFSKEMRDGSWSFVREPAAAADAFPTTTALPRYLPDHRTVVLPVKLRPRSTYVLWLNDGKRFNKFTDVAGRPALPYVITFRTR